MKKAFSILLLLPLLYTQVGYYGQFVIVRWRIQEAAREAWLVSLPDRAFVRLSEAAVNAGGKWEEAGKECWYAGHLYDVIRTRKVGKATILFCLDDEREERLIRDEGAVTRANLDHPDKKASHALSISIGDIFYERTAWIIEPLPAVLTQNPLVGVHRLPSCYSDILIPPPKYLPVLFS